MGQLNNFFVTSKSSIIHTPNITMASNSIVCLLVVLALVAVSQAFVLPGMGFMGGLGIGYPGMYGYGGMLGYGGMPFGYGGMMGYGMPYGYGYGMGRWY